jgi:Putative S-adenosyl-L-methionine-dependent methyltransferase
MEPAREPAGLTAHEVLEMARRLGPLPYSGRGRNPAPVLPSPSVLVGWQVEAVDGWWVEFGRPDPFTLVEMGAGDGSRAQAFLAEGPECLTAMRYVLVDDDPASREQQRAHLPIESPILVLGPVGPDDQDDFDDPHDPGGPGHEERTRTVVGIGPLITSLAEPPVVEGPAFVVAIGWASRLPSDRLEWRDGRWWEIRLSAGPNGMLSELPVPLDRSRAASAEQLAGADGPTPLRPEGARYAQLGSVQDWLARTLRVAESGRLVVIDRWTDVTRPLTPGEAPPLALDQLAAVRRSINAAPVDLSPDVSAVSWRLG